MLLSCFCNVLLMCCHSSRIPFILLMLLSLFSCYCDSSWSLHVIVSSSFVVALVFMLLPPLLFLCCYFILLKLQIPIGFCEPINTNGQTLAKILIELLNNYALKRKIITYVKDEGSNLNTMTTTLKSIIICDMLVWRKAFRAFVLVMHFPKLANML